MKILVVSQYYYPEPFRIDEICEELVKHGHKVTVLTANPNYPDGNIYTGYKNEDRVEVLNCVNVVRCKCRPRHHGTINLALNYLDFVVKASHKILSINDDFDCVYAYQLSPVTSCIPAIKYKRKYKIPLFLYCLDLWPESLRGTVLEKKPFYQICKYISKKIYKYADRIAVTSPAFIKYLTVNFGIDANIVQYIPQHSSELKTESVSNSFLDEYKDRTNFVFLGNIGEAQNLECLLYALASIKDRSNIMFHIVGSGSYYDKCVKLAEKLSLKDCILFYGRYPKDKMPQFYTLADVCYVSLKDEGIVGSTIPGKVQEYMSAAKPILACMNGDTPKVINEAKCGICVPAEEVDQLASEILKISGNEIDLHILGENARHYYEKHFTIASHINQVESLLRDMLEQDI